jgi:hypothetical protein
VAEQDLQVLVQQGLELQVVRVVSGEAAGAQQLTLLVPQVVEEETELSISTTRHHSRLVNLYSIKESHNGSN